MTTTRSDFVLWEAMHWDCPPDATCCTTHTVTIPVENLEALRLAALLERIPVQTFIGRAVSERIRAIYA